MINKKNFTCKLAHKQKLKSALERSDMLVCWQWFAYVFLLMNYKLVYSWHHKGDRESIHSD